MKKLIILTYCVLWSVCSFAQNPISLEAQAGLNVSTLHASGSDITLFGSGIGYSSIVGFHVGVRGTYDFQTPRGLYANAGVFLTSKGSSYDYTSIDFELYDKVRAYFLEFPVHAGYKYAFNNTLSVFGEFGPYFSVGLFGKTKISSSGGITGGGEVTYDTFGEDHMKRFDMGLGLRCGIELHKKYSLSVGYDFGLIDAYEGNQDQKHRNLSIGLGYKF